MEITSTSNPRVKQWSSLLNRRGREQHAAFMLEGIHLVQEALESGADVKTVLYSLDKGIPAELADYAAAGKNRTPEAAGSANLAGKNNTSAAAGSAGKNSAFASAEWIGVSDAVLAKCTETQTPQGVVAVCGTLSWTASQLLEQQDALVVVVDGVQDPGNLGTIIRTADAAGATGVLLGRGTVDLYNPKTVRSTMGSLFHLPVAECELARILPSARERGIRLVGTRLGASRHCYELDMRTSVWFLMGNEGSGLSPAVEAYVDTDIIIPMRGKAESLNVAVAASVLLYEAVRQRYFANIKNY
ncbi:MAG: methyltransferase [Paenibacillaceae bacterium]|jgi:TrmH family RNA methyltransferase|nr:methyltransferase [Paenibacillaceae bacterium]